MLYSRKNALFSLSRNDLKDEYRNLPIAQIQTVHFKDPDGEVTRKIATSHIVVFIDGDRMNNVLKNRTGLTGVVSDLSEIAQTVHGTAPLQSQQERSFVRALRRGAEMTSYRVTGRFIEYSDDRIGASALGAVALGAHGDPMSIIENGAIGVASFVFRCFQILELEYSYEGRADSLYEHLSSINDSDETLSFEAIARIVESIFEHQTEPVLA